MIRNCLIGVGVFIAIQAGVLFWLGQPPICTCGYVKIWEGVVLSPGNSQHLADWYTPSHIIHGILFYLLAWLMFPRWSVLQRLLLATGLEVGWEILENTPWVINLYRKQALAQGYTGDSIINSVMDTFSMILGFFIARRAAVWAAIAFLVFLELLAAYVIRDNLALNILGFIHQFDFISAWQMGK